MNGEGKFPAFRQVPMTGVIFVTTEAAKAGFSPHDPTWANLGQGAPEVGSFGTEEREAVDQVGCGLQVLVGARANYCRAR